MKNNYFREETKSLFVQKRHDKCILFREPTANGRRGYSRVIQEMVVIDQANLKFAFRDEETGELKMLGKKNKYVQAFIKSAKEGIRVGKWKAVGLKCKFALFETIKVNKSKTKSKVKEYYFKIVLRDTPNGKFKSLPEKVTSALASNDWAIRRIETKKLILLGVPPNLVITLINEFTRMGLCKEGISIDRGMQMIENLKVRGVETVDLSKYQSQSPFPVGKGLSREIQG